MICWELIVCILDEFDAHAFEDYIWTKQMICWELIVCILDKFDALT